jgi:hypothetical protein
LERGVTISFIWIKLYHDYCHLKWTVSRLLSLGKSCVTITVVWKELSHNYCHLERGATISFIWIKLYHDYCH